VGERLRLPLLVPSTVLVVAGGSGLVALLSASVHDAAGLAVSTALVVGGGLAAFAGWSRAEGDVAALRELAAARTTELDRVRAAYTTERAWNRELRRQIADLQQLHGALGDTSDTRRLILRVAIRLLGAQKGLLLSRSDLDGDGDLDLVVAEGFERDPGHIPVVQRFAREVIASDETVRDDDPDDAELDNLVAIPIYIRDRFSGVVVACNKPGGFHEHDDEVLLALGDHAGAVLQNAHLHGLLRTSYVKTIAMLADAVQAKDPLLRGHCEEVARLVAIVADQLGFEPQRREQLLFASLLHDIGKIAISERILLKPGPLTPEERAAVELHPRLGHRLVEQVPALRPMSLAVLHHHERWDGAGYPAGLKEDEIPLEARIIAVADTFDAMTTERPYRTKVTAEEACLELERCAGTQFDPNVVRAFVREVRRNPESARLIQAEQSLRPLDVPGDEGPLLGFGSFVLVDNLTLLYSHRHLHDVAAREARRAADTGSPFALVLVKLTELARTNREHGYAAGDALLQQVARVVQDAAGRCGGTPARLGGNCVALLVPGANHELAVRLAEELADDLADGPPTHLVTTVWSDGDSGEDVVDRAVVQLTALAAA
jgi:diguanylate cyclase (GGDEF)-like protein